MQIYDGRDFFYQWDSHQKLVGDFELYEKVEFGNGRVSPTYTLEAYEFNGEIVVDVPNILLQTALPIVVYRREIDGNSVATVLKQSFKVEQREKPSDYIYTETEVLTVQAAVENALQEAKDSGAFKGISGVGENAEVFNGGVSEQAVGEYDHAEGYKCKTTYARGHAEGDRTEAGWRSHAEGFYTYADSHGHAGGRLSKADGNSALAFGLELSEPVVVNGTTVKTTSRLKLKDGVAIVVNTNINGYIQRGDYICLYFPGNSLEATDVRRVYYANDTSIILEEPFYDPIQPAYSHIDQETFTFGTGAIVRKASFCEASGNGSVAVGCATKATGARSFAHGEKSFASGEYSEAGGRACEASGARSRASGTSSKASGSNSVAEGDTTTASATCAVATGKNTNASGQYSNANGYGTTASATCATAMGNQCQANGNGAVAWGSRTYANSPYQTARGISNIPDNEGRYADIVGNGNGANPSNAYTLDWNGNGWFAGTVETDAVILRSSTAGSNKKFKLTVNDSGTLSVVAIN